MCVATPLYLEASVKDFNIKKLQTGDLIKFKADIMPVIYHYGIIDRVNEDEIYILHNQNDFLNKSGGSLIREDFNKYVKGRTILSIEKTGLSRNELSEITEVLKDRKYHFIDNNCEHFINQIKTNKFISPQVAKWSLGVVLCLGLLYIIKKNEQVG